MAQRTPRSAAGKPAPARAAAKSKKAATSDVEVVEESPGIGIDAGIAIMTAVMLLAALVCTDKIMGMFGEGILFK